MLLPLPPVSRVGSPAPQRAVVVFAQSPAAEARAKPLRRRLPSRLGQPAAADLQRLHETLLRRTLRTATGLAEADILLVTTGDIEHGRAQAEKVVPASRLRVHLQAGPDFATRLAGAVKQAFAAYDQVVVIGSDTPELDTQRLRAAFDALGAPDRTDPRERAVLGLATDGGYYLLGLSRYTPAAFTGIPFGETQAAAVTMAALGRAGYAVHTLAPLADVDDAADLAALTLRLRRSAGPGDHALRQIALRVLAGRASFVPTIVPTHLPWPRRGETDARGPPGC